MDSMLKDASYSAELEALRRNCTDAHPLPETSANSGGGGATSAADADASEEDSQVSTSEALDMLRQVRAPTFSQRILPVHRTSSFLCSKIRLLTWAHFLAGWCAALGLRSWLWCRY